MAESARRLSPETPSPGGPEKKLKKQPELRVVPPPAEAPDDVILIEDAVHEENAPAADMARMEAARKAVAAATDVPVEAPIDESTRIAQIQNELHDRFGITVDENGIPAGGFFARWRANKALAQEGPAAQLVEELIGLAREKDVRENPVAATARVGSRLQRTETRGSVLGSPVTTTHYDVQKSGPTRGGLTPEEGGPKTAQELGYEGIRAYEKSFMKGEDLLPPVETLSYAQARKELEGYNVEFDKAGEQGRPVVTKPVQKLMNTYSRVRELIQRTGGSAWTKKKPSKLAAAALALSNLVGFGARAAEQAPQQEEAGEMATAPLPKVVPPDVVARSGAGQGTEAGEREMEPAKDPAYVHKGEGITHALLREFPDRGPIMNYVLGRWRAEEPEMQDIQSYVNRKQDRGVLALNDRDRRFIVKKIYEFLVRTKTDVFAGMKAFDEDGQTGVVVSAPDKIAFRYDADANDIAIETADGELPQAYLASMKPRDGGSGTAPSAKGGAKKKRQQMDTPFAAPLPDDGMMGAHGERPDISLKKKPEAPAPVRAPVDDAADTSSGLRAELRERNERLNNLPEALRVLKEAYKAQEDGRAMRRKAQQFVADLEVQVHGGKMLTDFGEREDAALQQELGSAQAQRKDIDLVVEELEELVRELGGDPQSVRPKRAEKTSGDGQRMGEETAAPAVAGAKSDITIEEPTFEPDPKLQQTVDAYRATAIGPRADAAANQLLVLDTQLQQLEEELRTAPVPDDLSARLDAIRAQISSAMGDIMAETKAGTDTPVSNDPREMFDVEKKRGAIGTEQKAVLEAAFGMLDRRIPELKTLAQKKKKEVAAK